MVTGTSKKGPEFGEMHKILSKVTVAINTSISSWSQRSDCTYLKSVQRIKRRKDTLMNETEVRKITCAWMSSKLEERRVNVFMGPTILHGKGSLSDYIKRKTDLSPLAATDKGIYEEVRTWDVEPDVVSIVEKNGKALVILAECKSAGSLTVEHLAQILLYSVVTRAHAAGIFFTGSLTKPVQNLVQNNIIKYEGFNETKVPVTLLIGLYSVGKKGEIGRIYPKYEVYDI